MSEAAVLLIISVTGARCAVAEDGVDESQPCLSHCHTECPRIILGDCWVHWIADLLSDFVDIPGRAASVGEGL